MQSAFAQDSTKTQFHVPGVKSIVTGFGQDLYYISSAPFRMNKRQAIKLSTFIMLNVASMYSLDKEMDREFRIDPNNPYNKSVEYLADVGKLYDISGTQNLGIAINNFEF